MTSRRELLFVVEAPGGERSQSWKVSVARDGSFYLMSRDSRGAVKVSIHPPRDGEPYAACFFGSTAEEVAKHPEMAMGEKIGRLQRFRPRPVFPGVTRVARLRIDSRAIKRRDPVSRLAAHLRFEPPPPGCVLVIDLVLFHCPFPEPIDEWDPEGDEVGGIIDESPLGSLGVFGHYSDTSIDVAYVDDPSIQEERKSEMITSLSSTSFDIDDDHGFVVVDEVAVLQGPPP